MRPPRPPRDPERGNSLLLALIVMSALATLGSLTVVSMQSSLQMSTNDRAQTIAMYAAESGAAVAMDFLRKNFDPSGTAPFSGATSWGAYCAANNQPPLVNMATVVLSSDARPGDAAHHNLFDLD
jgi:Tfp pilus assembly protein PilX